MAFEAGVLSVLIASPGDTSDARDAVEVTIAGFNRDRARAAKIILLPLRWETDAVPSLDDEAQAVINRELVDEADVVIALFHSRLGAPTRRAPSGTAEEIERARARGVPVHVYFSQMPLPYSVDTAELERLRQYQQQLQSEGLLGSFVSFEDLAAQVRTALERDVGRAVEQQSSRLAQPANLGLSRALEAVAGRGAIMRGRVVMGRPGDERLIVENIGQAPAENVTVEVEAIGGGRAPEVLLDGPIEVVPPGSSVRILVVVTMGVASQWRLTIRWTEGGVAFHEVQSLTPF